MKNCLIVLGMHRSGTSALMGVLKALNLDIGSDHYGPYPDNPKGFFELNDVIDINEQILSRFSSTWDCPFTLPENWWREEGCGEYKIEISNAIKNNFENADLMCIKEPRLCRTLPLWLEIFNELEISTYFIIPLRNPLEIARSLRYRSGLPVEKSLLLWMTYMLEAELYSRKFPRVFITFDRLLNDTQGTIDFVSKALHINFPEKYKDVKDSISQFLEKGLKHHNLVDPGIDELLSEEIFNFYSLLSQFAYKKDIAAEDLTKIDEIRNRYFGLNRLFYSEDIKILNNDLSQLIEENKKLNILKAEAVAERDNIISEKERVIEKKAKTIEKYESKFIYIPCLNKFDQFLRKRIYFPLLDFFTHRDFIKK